MAGLMQLDTNTEPYDLCYLQTLAPQRDHPEILPLMLGARLESEKERSQCGNETQRSYPGEITGPQLQSIQQVSLIYSALTVTFLLSLFNKRFKTRRERDNLCKNRNMYTVQRVKYEEKRSAISKRMHKVCYNPNQHILKYPMRHRSHQFLPAGSSCTGSLTFLFFLGPIISSWLNARSRVYVCKNHQRRRSCSQHRLLGGF